MPLEGIRIVSFNHFLMGPFGIQFLADLGAEVIAIEPIQGAFQRHWGGDNAKKAGGETTLDLVANRNKKSICLDLKNPAALEIAKKLIAGADVVAENFRPGVMEKLGLGHEALKSINPEVIFASASGFGADGPYVDRPGQDMIAQSLSGLAWITGKTGEVPRLVGTSAVDHHGAMIFAAGILGALVKKTRTGKGARVDVNLFSAALNLQAESLVCYFNGKKPEGSQQPAHIGSWYHEAPYGIYATADRYIGLSLGSLDVTLEALGIVLPFEADPSDAYVRREEISSIVAEKLREKPFAQWASALDARKIWYTQVNDYDDLAEDPQVKHNGDLVQVESWNGDPITLVANPVRYDGKTAPIRLVPQKLGAQTAEVLSELGVSEAQQQMLAETGAIGLG
ncbi:MAG: CaiB/BaiF CoA-transferase family protein [Rhizobiaceae bacterium]|nr:CaiB/BaiF CoA-transferase family protein [Rhizobiaceae bacterium]|tara:strand:- start:88225 stop:89412 length:1188 start_codon:yes stop_codon:yes gene_type:complete